MVRESSVKLMSKIAIYEKRQGKEEIPMNSYFKGDYVRMNCLKAVVSATIVYLVVAMMIAFYKTEYILVNVFRLDYKRIGMIALIIYAVWVLIYYIVARVMYSKKYEKARPNIIVYNHDLKKLQEESASSVRLPKGGVVINDDFIDL